jgi:hypothetical protein
MQIILVRAYPIRVFEQNVLVFRPDEIHQIAIVVCGAIADLSGALECRVHGFEETHNAVAPHILR